MRQGISLPDHCVQIFGKAILVHTVERESFATGLIIYTAREPVDEVFLKAVHGAVHGAMRDEWLYGTLRWVPIAHGLCGLKFTIQSCSVDYDRWMPGMAFCTMKLAGELLSYEHEQIPQQVGVA